MYTVTILELPSSKNHQNTINQESISLAGLVVNIVLATVAIYVLFLTRKQTRASITSVEVAKKVFEESKEYNGKIFEFQKKEADDATENLKKQFELQTSLVNAQLKSFEHPQEI